jgi:hypothetical protein
LTAAATAASTPSPPAASRNRAAKVARHYRIEKLAAQPALDAAYFEEIGKVGSEQKFDRQPDVQFGLKLRKRIRSNSMPPHCVQVLWI